MDDEYEYQVCGMVPEDEESEQFDWTSGRTHSSLEEARAEVQRRRDQDAIGEMWIERRSTKWERLP